MTLNNLMVSFQQCWSFGECGVPLYCHLQCPSITGTSPSDCFVSYSGHSSVYSTAPADWARTRFSHFVNIGKLPCGLNAIWHLNRKDFTKHALPFCLEDPRYHDIFLKKLCAMFSFNHSDRIFAFT